MMVITSARVLIVDDNIDDCMVLTRYLRSAGHLVRTATTVTEAIAAVRDHDTDCILLDWQMPEVNGLEMVQRLKADHELRFIPVIMLTGMESDENVVQGLAAGADDFVGKSSSREVLLARIEAALRIKVLQDELKRANSTLERMNSELSATNLSNATALQRINGLLTELRELSQRDSLTQLYNHGYFYEALSAEVRRMRRYGQNICCLMLDLDLFKQVNDSHGHVIGDKLLVAFAERIRRFFRETDLVARYGGEEFAVLLMSVYYDDAYRVAERFRKHIDSAPLDAGDVAVKVTISCGISSLLEDGVFDEERFVNLADTALYEAKGRGRNNTVIYREIVESRRPALHISREEKVACSRVESAQRAYIEAMRGLIGALEDRDPFTLEHSPHVMRYATLVARELHLTQDEVEVIGNAALLHDLGKISVRDEVLQKAGPLTALEYEEIKRHPALGVQLLDKSSYCRPERELILHHHERYDGRGYPDGLRGTKIPLGARIIAVADAYDAMLSFRHYRPRLAPHEAVEELVENAGTQFDPKVVWALLCALRRHGLLCAEVDITLIEVRLQSA